ncbi:hypothetical protein NPIL_167881 [Nephila pilipes]|uniref:Uncharacterized protein n=1 Tax=Nephila pilipes TaxID=299642 RepID=A0A8X6PSE7_NEPPI|nr:hypothetical protein NPIL_167881 [Nephila pilipes]
MITLYCYYSSYRVQLMQLFTPYFLHKFISGSYKSMDVFKLMEYLLYPEDSLRQSPLDNGTDANERELVVHCIFFSAYIVILTYFLLPVLVWATASKNSHLLIAVLFVVLLLHVIYCLPWKKILDSKPSEINTISSTVERGIQIEDIV